MKGIFAKGVITDKATVIFLTDFLDRRVSDRLALYFNDKSELSYKDQLMVKDVRERVTFYVCDILANIDPEDMGITLDKQEKENER